MSVFLGHLLPDDIWRDVLLPLLDDASAARLARVSFATLRAVQAEYVLSYARSFIRFVDTHSAHANPHTRPHWAHLPRLTAAAPRTLSTRADASCRFYARLEEVLLLEPSQERVHALLAQLPPTVHTVIIDADQFFHFPAPIDFAAALPLPLQQQLHTLMLERLQMDPEVSPGAVPLFVNLPPQLTCLTLPELYRHPTALAPLLPESLRKLWCDGCTVSQPGFQLPAHLSLWTVHLCCRSVAPVPPLCPLFAVPMHASLTTLTLSLDRHGAAELIAWLATAPQLTHLELSGPFDASLDDMQWPPQLSTLMLPHGYQHPLTAPNWPPASLTNLGLTGHWNLPLSQLRMGAALRTLGLSRAFDQPIPADCQWAPHLRMLDLGGYFSHPLVGVQWPATLEELQLSDAWNRPCTQLALPPHLRMLSFGSNFNQAVDTLVLPATLQLLEFGAHFNQAVGALQLHTLPHLHRLRFGAHFDQPVVAQQLQLPASLLSVEFGRAFRHSLVGMQWPPALRFLTLLRRGYPAAHVSFPPAQLHAQQPPAAMLPHLPARMEAITRRRANADEAAQVQHWQAAMLSLPSCALFCRQ